MDSSLENLVIRFRNGEDLASELVQAHIPLVHSYARRSGIKDDEVKGYLFLELVKAVRRAQNNLHDNNITPYIIAAFRTGLRKYREALFAVTVPESSFRRGKRVGFESLMEHHTVRDGVDLLELKELLERITVDELDSSILDLLLKGYTHNEVSLILSLEVHQVVYRLRNIRTRCRAILCVPSATTRSQARSTCSSTIGS